MHVIIGGAYNGKKSYVSELLTDVPATWYDGQLLPENERITEVAVVYAIEKIVCPLLDKQEEVDLAQAIFQQIMALDESYKTLYLVLEDMGRGIVPIDKQQRKLRDVLGRLYQLVFAYAQSITRVWYGIPQQLK